MSEERNGTNGANGTGVKVGAYQKHVEKRNRVLTVLIIVFAAIAACAFIASATLFVCGRNDDTHERYIWACFCLFFAGISLLVATGCLFLKTTQRGVKQCAVCGALSAKKSAFCCACGAPLERQNVAEYSADTAENLNAEDHADGGENG